MKMYIAEYGWTSSGAEQSVVFAESLEGAQKFILDDDSEVVFIDGEPKDCRESEYGTTECRITEEPIELGIVYTGHFCC